MKNLIKLFVIIGLVLAVAFSGCLDDDENGDENITINADGFYRNMTLSDDNKSINFEFTTNPSTGYGWTVSGASGIFNESENTVLTPNRVGAPGLHILKYDALKSGTATLNFVYERSFEEGTTLENLTYVFSVAPDNTIEVVSISSNNEVLYFQNLTTDDKNKTAQMILKGNPSTGYTWDVSAPGKILKTVKEGLLLADDSDADDPIVGAPGFFVWEFAGLQKGNETLTFDYQRNFEKDSTLEKGVYTFSVDDDQAVLIRSVSLVSVI